MIKNPLINVEAWNGQPVPVEETGTGWFFRTPVGLRGQVKGFGDAIVCRLAAGEDPDVVQVGIGTSTSRLCNALYSPTRDIALVFIGDDLTIEPVFRGRELHSFTITCSGPLTINVLEHYLRVHRNLPWYAHLDKRHFPRPPAGWCSWYYYYLNINEDEVVKNTDWLAKHLKKFGCEWVQIDDGWQGRGEGYGTNRDWFATSAVDFPHGMKWIAEYIRGKGLRPGIWCIPQTQSDTELYTRQPALFVKNEDGSSPGERSEPLGYEWMQPESERQYDWAGRYYIDPTGVEGRQYLERLFTMLCQEWGYEYVKIDAQGMMPEFYHTHRQRLADPSLDGDRAYRTLLSTARSAMGANRFLLNCAHALPSDGLCEGLRIGSDVDLRAGWQGLQPAIESTMRWLFLNNIAFYTDPDVVCVREPLPYEMAKTWVTLVGITGQLLMASDRMYDLPDERVELLRRIFPVKRIHPMELYPLDAERKPSIFDLKVNLPAVAEWDVVALFNWSDTDARTVELSSERLGLADGRWICLDAWTGELLHVGDGTLSLELPPASSRTVSVWREEKRPQFVGTNRHLTQGAVDVRSLLWDEKRLRLSGVSNVVGGDPYHIRFYLPPNYVLRSPGVQQHGQIAELVITRPHNTQVRWHVDFGRL